MTDTNRPGRGGKREGAGRKPKYPGLGKTRDIVICLPTALIEFVDAEAAGTGLSRSEWLARRLIRARNRAFQT